ncbi:NAD(P)-dependent oxidoreductase [Jiangella asiatica]|uniref:NAD(P)-dependent oxidoreductase n=1 Tax=Jiangella asiatica TaxID=2530372 RepID=A0A4R5DN45_9ACTN|nr:NAD(P)-dependent oxidoreductase [Jiangella asiatica]
MGETVGMIGLGNLGRAVAARLVGQGVPVMGHDPSAAASAAAEADGVPVAGSLAEVARRARVVFTCVPNSEVVEQVWLGDDGLLAQCEEPTTLVELSTIDPATMVAAGAAAAARGHTPVDVGVSRGPDEVRRGALSLLVGGAADDDAVTGLLAHLGQVHHVGPVGAGKTVKLVNNLISISNMAILAEGFTMGLRAGVPAQTLYDVLNVSGASSQQLDRRVPRWIAGDDASRFSIALADKDLCLGLDLARDLGVPTPMASAARSLYSIMRGEGMADADIVAALDLYGRWAG